MTDADLLVIDRPDDERYVLLRDGDELGFAAYTRADGVITFTHTEIDPAVQERGLGSRLVHDALEAVRSGSEDRVVAQCPFVATYIEEHPEYRELTERTPSEGVGSTY